MAEVTTEAAVIEQKRTRTLLEDVRAGERWADELYRQAEQILATAVQENDSKSAIGAI